MNEDLKFNNIPSAELEGMTPAVQSPVDSVSKPSETNVENSASSEQEAPSVSLSKQEEADSKPQTDANAGSPQTNSVQASQQADTTPPNAAGSDNSAPKTRQDGYRYPPNTARSRAYVRNSPPQSGYQYPPNTARSRAQVQNAPRQNGYQYPQNTARSREYIQNNPTQNGYRTPPNTRPPHGGYQYPQNGYNAYQGQNGYQYPPNGNAYSYPQSYPQQNGYGSQTAPYVPQGYAPASAQPYQYQVSPKMLEKLSLSKVTSAVGGLEITITITMVLLEVIIIIIAVMCGVMVDVPSESDPYYGFTAMGFYLFEGLLSMLSIFIPTLIFIKKSNYSINELVPFRKIEGKKLLAIVFCGMGVCMAAQVMVTLIGINFSVIGIDIYEGLDTESATGVFDWIMTIICTAVIPPLIEEFAYRGFIAGSLKKYDDLLAVFASAFIFGMGHGNLVQIPFAFMGGLVFGYVRVKTDSMIPSILIHFGNNLFAVIINNLSEMLPEPYGQVVDVSFMIILIIAGFIAAAYLLKTDKDFFRLERKKSYLTYGEKLKTFMTSGTVIVSCVILSAMALYILLKL